MTLLGYFKPFAVASCALIAAVTVLNAEGGRDTVKVFILAGQSNMEGKAANALIEHQATDPKTRHHFAHLRSDDGWRVRDDVFIKFLNRRGPLTIGYGSPNKTGPELEFGHIMGEHFEEPVLLIKTAWGGHSLYQKFRSPSSGLPAEEHLAAELERARERTRKNNERRNRNDPLPTMDDIKTPYGSSYRAMLLEVRETLRDLGTLFPELEGMTPEINGFVWFQGWNDMFGDHAPGEYADNLKRFIKDARRDLGKPELPVVIAAMGNNGSKPAQNNMKTVQAAQLSMNDVPEFSGNVRAFRTDVLVDKAAEALYPTWKENFEAWKLVGSDRPYHYLGSVIWYTRIGHGMGQAMLGLLGARQASASDDSLPDSLRLNQVQVIGTHNSYHLEPPGPVMALIRGVSSRAADSIAYSHKPLAEQLGRLGIRLLEWDLYADPEGGLFANPAARRIIQEQGGDPGPHHDPEGLLQQPGLKMIHSPDFDYLTTSLTFRQALTSLRDWSKKEPEHLPIMVLIELKESSSSPLGVRPLKFDAAQLDGVDGEILQVFRRNEIVAPDDVRSGADSLREAVLDRGWPLLSEVRGKVMFALDNGGALRDAYLDGHPSLRGRLLFASVDETHPAAAWFKINDPIGEFDRIQRIVRAGFLVRTRADAGTVQARENDPTRRERAFASGAQFVSTDYPEPDPRFSGYQVRFEGGAMVRSNPVSGVNQRGEGPGDR